MEIVCSIVMEIIFPTIVFDPESNYCHFKQPITIVAMISVTMVTVVATTTYFLKHSIQQTIADATTTAKYL